MKSSLDPVKPGTSSATRCAVRLVRLRDVRGERPARGRDAGRVGALGQIENRGVLTRR
jgi:hypothetical protein